MQIRLKPPAEQVAEIDIESTIEQDAFALIQKGFVPSSSDDKWVIHMDQAHRLYIHRAASGSCIFFAQFAPVETESGETAFTITKATVNRNPDEYRQTDTAYDAKLFVYLLRKLLLKHDVPFPQKARMSYEDRLAVEKEVMGGDDAPTDVIPLDLI